MDEKVSVVIPIYNSEKYLKKCVDSVINQTYENLEIILVDDGSTDKSGVICDDYAREDGRIKVIHQKNSGLSASRNNGMDMATGQYIIFVDSDDYVSDKMVETLYRRLILDKSDMAIGGFLRASEDGKNLKMDTDPIMMDTVMTGKDMLLEIQKNKSVFHYSVVSWNRLVKLDIHRKIKFPVGKLHEDQFILHNLLNECGKISCVPGILYYYVDHNSGITADEGKAGHLDLAEAYFARSKFAIENGYNGMAVTFARRAVRIIAENYNYIDTERVASLKQNFDNILPKLIKISNGENRLIFAVFHLNPRLLSKIRPEINNHGKREK